MRFPILFLIGFFIAFQALALGVVNLFGQGYEHQKVTNIALKGFGFGPKTLKMLAGDSGSLGAIGAPDRLNRGLADVRYVHCDNGDYFDVEGYPQTKEEAQANLEKCKSHIFKQLEIAIALSGKLAEKPVPLGANSKNELNCRFVGKARSTKCGILEALGLAFHAAQDFYTHSNWSDRTEGTKITVNNPPGLGKEVIAEWLNPRLNALLPDGLITGCFLGMPETTKCSYGNGKQRIRHYFLNKDIGNIGNSVRNIGAGKTIRGRHNQNFQRVIRLAVEDTRNKWLFVEEEIIRRFGQSIGSKVICKIKKDDSDLCL